jgi:outer membrane receptor protein involved in Fe transport
MKIFLVYTCCFLFSISFSFAQTGTLTGTISDANTAELLIGATIKSGNTGTTSDGSGNYVLRLPEGTHAIEFSYIGFANVTKTVTIKADESLRLDVQMGETPTLLQTATVSTSKYEKPLGEVTVSLEVLKPNLIDNTNATNIDQPLQKVGGVNVIDGQANIRGGSGWSYGAGSRVLLLIDDIPALQADAGFPNWVDVPIENIAQVEIVKGAASALYGSSAMNGIINIKTAYATSKPYTRISTFYKHYDNPKRESLNWWDEENTIYEFDDEDNAIDSVKYTPRLFGGEKGYNRPAQLGINIAHRQKVGKTDLILGAYGLLDESYRQGVYSNYARFNAGIKHRINDKLSLGFNSNFNRGIGRSTFYWAALPKASVENPANYLPDTRAFSNSNRFRFTIDPYLNYFDANGNQHKVLTRFYGINNKNDNEQSNASQLYYTEYQFLKRWEAINLNLTTGVLGTWTKVDAPLYRGIYKSANYASFLQLDKKVGDKVNLSFGARYEFNQLKNPDFYNADTIFYHAATDRDSRPVFRAGLNYQIAAYTFLRASWGQGYRFPVIAEKFIYTEAGGLTIIPNPALQPETGWSTEIGFKQGFRILNFNGYLDAAIFRNDYTNMMEFGVAPQNPFNLFPPPFQSNNIGDTKVTGLDISLVGEGKVGNVTSTLLSGYTYIRPKYTNYDSASFTNIVLTTDYNILKYRSRHSFKFDLESRYQMFSIGLSTIYNSRIEAIDPLLSIINRIGEYQDNFQQKGYTRVDARIAFLPSARIKVSLLSENILNRDYVVRPGLLEGPRSYTLRLDYTL